MDLAAAQWRALAALLSCPTPTAARTLSASTSTPSASEAARVTKSVVSRFVHMHGTVLGSGPFLRGFRLLLETQRGAETTVAWRLKPAVLTQSGGEAWMRDAVGLLLVSAHRRRDCEQGEGAYCPKAQYCDDGGGVGGQDAGAAAAEEAGAARRAAAAESAGEAGVEGTAEAVGAPKAGTVARATGPRGVEVHDGEECIGEWLAWSLPLDLGDADIADILSALPTHAVLEHRGRPTGSVFDAHRCGGDWLTRRFNIESKVRASGPGAPSC
jgi:hypothetical protein